MFLFNKICVVALNILVISILAANAYLGCVPLLVLKERIISSMLETIIRELDSVAITLTIVIAVILVR